VKTHVAIVVRVFTKTALTKSHGLISYGYAVAVVISPGNPRA